MVFGPVDGLRVVQLYIIGDLVVVKGRPRGQFESLSKGFWGIRSYSGFGLIRPGFSVGSLKIKGVRKNPVW